MANQMDVEVSIETSVSSVSTINKAAALRASVTALSTLLRDGKLSELQWEYSSVGAKSDEPESELLKAMMDEERRATKPGCGGISIKIYSEERLNIQPLKLIMYAGEAKMWKPFWVQFSACVNARNNSSEKRLASTSKSMMTATLVGGTTPVHKCHFCDDLHPSQDCRKFGTLQSRKETLIAKGRCFSCFQQGHRASTCSWTQNRCGFCRKSGHHISLCASYVGRKRVDICRSQKGMFMQTFTCKCRSSVGIDLEFRGLLDTGSRSSYITSDAADKLGLARSNPTELSISAFGSSEPMIINSAEVLVNIIVRNSLERGFRFLTTPCITGAIETLPSVDVVRQILPPHLKYADLDLFSTHRRKIDILIGNDLYHEIISGRTKRLPNNIVLIESIFGWVPSGAFTIPNLDAIGQISLASVSSETNIENLDKEDDQVDSLNLSNIWSLEAIGIKSKETDETDDLVLQRFRETVRFENGRYTVRWPWRSETPNITTNFRMCIARLRSMLERTPSDTLQECNRILLEQKSLGIIEDAPRHTPFLTHYLPMKPVLRNNKTRLVYDASAKTKSGHSLNSLLHRGPVLLEDLVGLLLNFRLHKIGLIADIEKAFLQIELNEVDRDAVRFIWVKDWNDPLTPGNLIHYRFKRVPFGIVSSPFLLGIVLQELLASPPKNDWLLKSRDRFYVDNLVTSVKDVPSAICFYESLTARLRSAGFRLRDWDSNNIEFLRSITNRECVTTEPSSAGFREHFSAEFSSAGFREQPSTESSSAGIRHRFSEQNTAESSSAGLRHTNRNSGVPELHGTGRDQPIARLEPNETNVLGIIWNKRNDTLRIKFDDSLHTGTSTLATKRQVLSFLASIYDPMGLISPSILDLKLLVQSCWKLKIKWDAPLPANLLARWLKLYSEAKLVSSIAIPRRYWDSSEKGTHSLHIFCDASKKAYACCAYLTYSKPSKGEFVSSLVFSKIRLAPIKELTIPKLELLGVLIGKRMSVFLASKLDIDLDTITLWTDSTTVLQWLNSVSILPIFVQNRINEIRQGTNLSFRYVPTECNPADIASRGIKAELLKDNDLWWHGPPWLVHKNLWPAMPPNVELYNASSTAIALVTSVNEYSGLLNDRLEKRFPSWNSYVRMLVYILTFGKKRNETPLSSVELFKEAEIFLIKELQKKYFLVELAKLTKGLQPNDQLDLFLDPKGLIRCKGRLQNIAFPWDTIHPILLPKSSPLTRAYIRGVHIENHHIGCSHLLAKIRERFWIIKGRSLVKSIIHKCVTCRTWEGGSFRLPPLPPLPLVRVAEASPFLHSGLDYLGPLFIENERGVVVKTYVCLFVCLVTRAIHLELVRDLSADEFLMCFTRFVSRRGIPKFVISDNATNFVFVQPLVGRRIESSNYTLNNFMTSNNIQWKFIPQYAPWYGGAYERLVSLVKRSLKKSYGRLLLDYVQLNTALCHIEDVINSRPLTYVGEEVVQPLTPNHFLRLRTCNVVDILEVTPLPSTREHLVEAFGHVAGVVSAFWDSFRSLYLLALREQHSSVHPPKKGVRSYCPKPGDIVLVKEPSAPRSDWKYGVIKKLDKRQALAYVACKKQMIIRSINQLFPLELSIKTPEPESTPQPSTSMEQ